MVLLALQFLTPDFYYIPKAALASVITSSVIFMVEPDIVMPLWRSKPMDLIPWGITFLVTLVVGLEFGILVGLCISTLYLLYYAARPRVALHEAETIQGGTKFILIALDRSLTFPSVDYITYQVNKSVLRFGQKNTPAVVDCHHIQYTDFTAAEVTASFIPVSMKSSGRMLHCCLNFIGNEGSAGQLARAGIPPDILSHEALHAEDCSRCDGFAKRWTSVHSL